VLFLSRRRRILQDVVTCIRHNCAIDDAGFRRERHADRYLKPRRKWPGSSAAALKRWARTLDNCGSLPLLAGRTHVSISEEALIPALTRAAGAGKDDFEGAADRYPEGVPDKVIAILKHELRLIETLPLMRV